MALPALLMVLALAGAATSAHAAAEVHKLNLVINVIPTSVDGGDFNREIDDFDAALARQGLQTLDHVSFGWQFGGEVRYFMRPNIALVAGISQLRATREREYLPSLTSDVVVTGEILSAPIHVGADYYFTAYNQGDFRAQLYAGGGLLGLTSTHSRLQVVAVGDTAANAQGFKTVTAGDGTGFYGELGVHMFFALRYSVMLGAIYRSAEVRPVAVYFTGPGYPQETYFGTTPRSLSASGVGVKAALAIGL